MAKVNTRFYNYPEFSSLKGSGKFDMNCVKCGVELKPMQKITSVRVHTRKATTETRHYHPECWEKIEQ